MKPRYLYILLLLLLHSCAKVVTPVGGPKDLTPPKMLKEQPASGVLNYTGEPIKITFDEYFTLNNPGENVLISPPLENTPEFRVKGKTLIVRFNEVLQPNSTYNMVFSNCIQDFHEGNKLSLFHYSFATGSVLDSFQLTGRILDAESLQPEADFFVLLYDRNIDSLPCTTRPSYVTKSLSNGTFRFENIKPGDYKILALKDINANLLYDLPNERIAYCDTMVSAHPAPSADTTDGRDSTITTAADLLLYAFTQADSVPVLLRYDNPAAGIYRFPYKSAFNTFEARQTSPGPEHLQHINATRDTVTWYFTSPVTDTINYILTADGRHDTVQIKPYKRTGGGRGTRGTPERLSVAFANAGHRYEPLTLNFSYPIRPIDSFTVFLCSKNDTSTIVCPVPDRFTLALPVTLPLEDKKSYTVIIPDSTFWGHNDLTHDTLRTQFTVKTEKDYGNLLMHYVLADDSADIIAQLWEGQRLIQEDILTGSRDIPYPHLTPGSYRVRIIKDRNRNGRWDTGNYLLKQAPEEVILFPSAINIRAYWDQEETFTIQ